MKLTTAPNVFWISFIPSFNWPSNCNNVSMTTPPILILGMHRSGTSCLAGQLEEAGVWLGEVRRASPHNAKGNRENPAIWSLNEAVLRANGAAWDRPPGNPVNWSAAQRAERDRILAQFPSGEVWGFKDPRTLFTLDGWREVLPDARLIGTLRHPLAVARSLQARSQMPLNQGLTLWTAYNRRLLDLVHSEAFPIVSFDQSAADYKADTGRLISELGLDLPSGQAGFFDDGLRHHNISDEGNLPPETAAMYAALQEMAAE